MKKNNLLVILSLSIITFFTGCSMDAIDNESPQSVDIVASDNVLPVCIVTNSGRVLSKNHINYNFFKYDELNRIVEIKSLSTNDSILTFVSYESDKIEVVKVYSDGQNKVTVYNYDGSTVIAEGEKPIYIDEKQQVTSYTKERPYASYDYNGEVSFTYDENGNVSSYTSHLWNDERTMTETLKYDDKNGIFRNVKTPSWFLVTQIGEVAYRSLYNNCILSGEEIPFQTRMNGDIYDSFSGYGYEYTYNSANYPEEISRTYAGIVSDSYLSYEIYYIDTEAPAIPLAEPIFSEPYVYDLSASCMLNEAYVSNIFIGKAIRSFKPETREMLFGNILANLYEFAPTQLDIYREKELLINATVIASDAPQTVNDLVFLIDVEKREKGYYPDEFRYYFLDGYPALDEIADSREREEARRIREINAQKREVKWGAFLDYLTETGKIVK